MLQQCNVSSSLVSTICHNVSIPFPITYWKLTGNCVVEKVNTYLKSSSAFIICLSYLFNINLHKHVINYFIWLECFLHVYQYKHPPNGGLPIRPKCWLAMFLTLNSIDCKHQILQTKLHVWQNKRIKRLFCNILSHKI